MLELNPSNSTSIPFVSPFMASFLLCLLPRHLSTYVSINFSLTLRPSVISDIHFICITHSYPHYCRMFTIIPILNASSAPQSVKQPKPDTCISNAPQPHFHLGNMDPVSGFLCCFLISPNTQLFPAYLSTIPDLEDSSQMPPSP